MITRKIHQLSKDKNLKEYELYSQKLLQRRNPNYKYKLWTDTDLEDILHHHPKLQAKWPELRGIQKADLGRYLVLYLEGGFYCDTDFYVQDSFDTLDMKDNTTYMAPSTRDFVFMKNGITNYFIYAPPRQDFFIELINEALEKIETVQQSRIDYISATTGKELIRGVINQSKQYDIKSFDPDLIINKHCSHTDVRGAFGYHSGSSSRENQQESWVSKKILHLLGSECQLRKTFKVKGNLCQYPVVTSFLVVSGILIAFIAVIVLYRVFK